MYTSGTKTSVVASANAVEHQVLTHVPPHRNVVSLLSVLPASTLTSEIVAFLPDMVRGDVAPMNYVKGQPSYLKTTVLLLEHLPHTLTQFLQQHGRAITPLCRTNVALQLAEAVHHLLRSGVVHMDLKTDNVLVDADTDHLGLGDYPKVRVVVIDFGSAKMTCQGPAGDGGEGLDEGLELRVAGGMRLEGNHSHLAPEVLDGQRRLRNSQEQQTVRHGFRL
jgi:serine/threonine protein kinase